MFKYARIESVFDTAKYNQQTISKMRKHLFRHKCKHNCLLKRLICEENTFLFIISESKHIIQAMLISPNKE